MTSQPLYMKPHPICRVTYALHLWHHSPNQCHHSHSIDHITHSLYGITLAICVACLHYTRHNILTLWHQATIFMKPQSLYLTSYILYLCHHTHCLGYITQTKFLRSHLLYMMTSYPLYMTSQPLNVCHHTYFFNGITPFVCRTSHPLCVSYHIHCIKHYLHI